MKVLIKGWVHALPKPTWAGDSVPPASFHFLGYKSNPDLGFLPICEASIEVDVPDDFNIVAAQVENLKQQQDKALSDYQEKVASINERLSKLLAITNGEPTS